MTLILFLARNNKWLEVPRDGLYRIAVKVAESDPKIKGEIIKILNEFIEFGIR